MFDFANSSYTILIATVAFSRYFRTAVVGVDDPRGDFLWGLAAAMAHVVLILISPLLGAIADRSGLKKRFLLVTTIQTVVATSLLYLVGPGSITLGMVLFIVATIGFEAGYIFYNAFLPEVSTPETVGRVSGWSWGTGFIGGLVALVACSPFLNRPLVDPSTGALDSQAVSDWRLSFVIVAVFFALFAIPTFMFLREQRPAGPRIAWSSYAAVGLQRVRETLTHLRSHREAGKFVLAYMFFFGGIEAIIKFSAIYADVTFGIEAADLLFLFIVTNIIAAPGTVLAGYLADWIGAKRAIAVTLVGWILLMFWGAAATSITSFWVLAGGIAIGVGSTQAIGRSFMTRLAPRDRESEFFGYYIQAGRIGSILALPLFGWISSSTGNQRLAVLWLVPLFALGLLMTLIVKDSRPTAPSTGQA
jgi:UMF1 family MFS transporter